MIYIAYRTIEGNNILSTDSVTEAQMLIEDLCTAFDVLDLVVRKATV